MTDSATPADETWTVQKILQWTTSYLTQQHIESARLEAELLLAHARGCQRIHLYADFEAVVSDTARARMREFVTRRAKREPLAYITGQREFYGRDFRVGPGVLIPRPETETLIDVCLERIPKQEPQHICEVGFGSGCVAVTLACQRPNVTVFASDCSRDALAFADMNAKEHDVVDRLQLSVGDLFEPFRQLERPCFDGVVSNPPYIREDELSGLAPEVGQHEPHRALVAGADGLDVVRRLIAEAPAFLRPNGWMAVEVDPAQCATVETLLQQAGFTDPATHPDLSQNNRVVAARLGRRK